MQKRATTNKRKKEKEKTTLKIKRKASSGNRNHKSSKDDLGLERKEKAQDLSGQNGQVNLLECWSHDLWSPKRCCRSALE